MHRGYENCRRGLRLACSSLAVVLPKNTSADVKYVVLYSSLRIFGFACIFAFRGKQVDAGYVNAA